jgi:hypothetical protein
VTRTVERLSRPLLVDRIVYATITMMSVLIIYDGWQQRRLIDVCRRDHGTGTGNVPRSRVFGGNCATR